MLGACMEKFIAACSWSMCCKSTLPAQATEVSAPMLPPSGVEVEAKLPWPPVHSATQPSAQSVRFTPCQ